METGARQRFGRYETLFRIAGGGMAEVYVARALGEAGFQKIVALKRMRPELAEDARFVTMFLDEGRLAANIASPHVVSTLDLGRAEDNSLYLVMELVTGTSLQALMYADDENTPHPDPIPVPVAVDLIVQAAQGLHDAHEATSPAGEPLDIVHRDCSPHNILVDVKGQVRITDFGIAKAMERQTQSHAGEMKGKLAYLSPEQARGLPADRRVDIFILGIVAWETFAGRQLFDAEYPVEALHKVANMPIPLLTEVRPDVSPEIAAAVAQALERDPDVRFATAAAFGNALTNALGHGAPQRTNIEALVRERGGDSLARLERGIRTALGKKGDSVPPPGSVEAISLPRAAALPSMGGPRQRRRTQGLGSPPSSPPPATATRAHGGPSEPPPGPRTAPLGMMAGGNAPFEPLGIEAHVSSAERPIPLRATRASEPVEEAPRRVRSTVALPEPVLASGPSALRLPEDATFPDPARKGGWGTRIAAGVALLALATGAGALGAWYSESQPVAEVGPPPIEAAEPVAPEPVVVPAARVDAPAPVEVPVVAEPAQPEPSAGERPPPRAASKVRRPPRAPEPVPTLDEAPNPVGDRAATFDEIPWR